MNLPRTSPENFIADYELPGESDNRVGETPEGHSAKPNDVAERERFELSMGQ